MLVRKKLIKIALSSLCLSFIPGCFAAREVPYIESGITNLTQLTFEKNSIATDPEWSSENNTILFSSSRSGTLELWELNLNSGTLAQLTQNNSYAHDRYPSYSPDKKTIVFQSNRINFVNNIWKMKKGDRGLIQLTNTSKGAFTPKISPDGSKIVFSTQENEGSYIWLMNIDGGDKMQLGPGLFPSWSPDGSKIIYSRNTAKNFEKPNYDIWMMNADGSSPIQLTTDSSRQEYEPRFSPQGHRIIYTSQFQTSSPIAMEQNGTLRVEATQRSEIWMMDATGKNQTQLTAFQGVNDSPTWSPDSKRVIFASSRGGQWNLWSMIPVSELN